MFSPVFFRVIEFEKQVLPCSQICRLVRIQLGQQPCIPPAWVSERDINPRFEIGERSTVARIERSAGSAHHQHTCFRRHIRLFFDEATETDSENNAKFRLRGHVISVRGEGFRHYRSTGSQWLRHFLLTHLNRRITGLRIFRGDVRFCSTLHIFAFESPLAREFSRRSVAALM